jgi:hypothetical protein
MLPALESMFIFMEYREREFIGLRAFHAEEQHRVLPACERYPIRAA